MKFDKKFCEDRLKYLAHTFIEGDMWYGTNCPAETIATYAAYTLDIVVKKKSKVGMSDKQKEDFKFMRKTFIKYLKFMYSGGVIQEELQRDLKITFQLVGEYFADLIDVYALAYDKDLWKYDKQFNADNKPFTIKRKND